MSWTVTHLRDTALIGEFRSPFASAPSSLSSSIAVGQDAWAGGLCGGRFEGRAVEGLEASISFFSSTNGFMAFHRLVAGDPLPDGCKVSRPIGRRMPITAEKHEHRDSIKLRRGPEPWLTPLTADRDARVQGFSARGNSLSNARASNPLPAG